jgi:signal transduction histidine kinase
LKELDQLKSRFFANISHEFRTPLTLIEGPAKQLASGEFPDGVKEPAAMIVRASQRLLRLVNQLLDLSRIEAGQMKLRIEETNMCELLKGSAAAFESLAKEKGITFSVQCSGGPVIGRVDRDAVEKIVTNLLSNAFKFTQTGGKCPSLPVGMTLQAMSVSA